MDCKIFYEWEEKIKLKFKELFEPPEEVEGEVNIELTNDLTWIAMVNRLANDDPTKHAAIYKMNYIEVLTTLMYWNKRDKAIRKAKQIAELRAKNKR